MPQIVKAAAHDDGGRAFVSKLFTLGTVVLLVVTALATIAAPWLVQLYAPGFPPDQQALATAFAYWCLPQILFYGLYALVGEALNARRVFGPFTWAPIVNNVVSIAGFLVFIVLFGAERRRRRPGRPQMIALLAGTATLGIVVQAVILLMLLAARPACTCVPISAGAASASNQLGRLAGWTFLMVVAGQLAGLVQSRVLSDAAEDDPGVLVTQNAWLLFMLPYSIIVLSIGTPYFTQLSEHAAAGRDDDVRGDIGRSIRTLGLFIVIATAALAGGRGARFADLHRQPRRGRRRRAACCCASSWASCPLAVLFVVQRTFYAYDDTRTPFFFTLAAVRSRGR